jgi:hypothetical protein
MRCASGCWGAWGGAASPRLAAGGGSGSGAPTNAGQVSATQAAHPHRLQVKAILQRMRAEWLGSSYDLLTRNCCHFCEALAEELGVGPIPPWLNRFASGTDATLTFTSEAISTVSARSHACFCGHGHSGTGGAWVPGACPAEHSAGQRCVGRPPPGVAAAWLTNPLLPTPCRCGASAASCIAWAGSR